MLPLSHITFAFMFSKVFLYANDTKYPYFEVVAVIGGLLPDVLDKILYYSKWCHASRSYGHSILFCSICTIILYYFTKDRILCGILFSSLFSHLIADLFFGFVPVFYPFQKFKYPSMIYTRSTKKQLRVIEAISSIIVMYFSIPQTCFLFIYNILHNLIK